MNNRRQAKIASLIRHIYAKFVSIMLVGSFAFFTVQAAAQTPITGEPQFDVFQLSADAQVEVDNDLMNVRLVAQATNANAAALANEINATMGWALLQLKPFTTIETQTLSYQTYPQYERGGAKIKGWVANQTLLLETDDFENAGKAIQILQEKLQVQSMQLTAKVETRKKAEEQLINKALNAFKRRAELVQTNMGAPGFRVMNLSINTQGSRQQFHREGAMRASSADMSVASAPAIEGGTSSVTVHVNGQIQLQ